MVFWKSSSYKCRRKKSCEYSKEQRKEFRGKATCSLGLRAVCIPLPGAGRLDTARSEVQQANLLVPFRLPVRIYWLLLILMVCTTGWGCEQD